MILTPDRYDLAPVVELLREAERGRVAFDHRLLRSLEARRDETVAALIVFASEIRDDRVVDLEEQVFDLYRQLRPPEAAAHYVRILRGLTGDTPDELVQAFRELGPAAVDPLLEFRKEVGPEDAADVPFLLAALGVKDARIFETLLETLSSDPYEGALCLGLYEDAAAVPSLEEALGALAPDAVEERKLLVDTIAQLRHGPPSVRDDAPFDIFALYPDRGVPPIDALSEKEALEFLDCSEPDYRRDAALSFCDEEYGDSVFDALCARAFKDAEPAVRAACLRAMGARGDDPRAKAILREAMEDAGRSVDERRGALVGLAQQVSDERVFARMLSFYESPETRAGALEAMWRSFDERFVDYFVKHAEDPDLSIRRQAISGIGAFNLSRHAHLLVPSLADDEIREETLFAYALAIPGKTSRKSVHSLLERIDDHAGGLSPAEVEIVEAALDRRLEREGLEPVFHPAEDEDEDNAPVPPARSEKVGRNDPCPCGSGKKYKKSCGT